MASVLYCVYLICSVVLNLTSGGDFCNTGYFGDGLCRPISQCKILNKLKQSANQPYMCGIDASEPLVCCPRQISQQKTTTTRPKQKDKHYFHLNENSRHDDSFLNDDNFNSNSQRTQGGGLSSSGVWGRNERPSFATSNVPRHFKISTYELDEPNPGWHNTFSESPQFWNDRPPKSDRWPSLNEDKITNNNRPGSVISRPDDVNAWTNSFNNGPDNFSSRPGKHTPKQNTFNTMRNNVNSQTDRPNNFNTKPDRFNTRPNTFNSRPDSFNSRPDDFNSRPGSFNSRPDDFNSRPSNSNSRPGNFDPKPNTGGWGNNNYDKPPSWGTTETRTTTRPEVSSQKNKPSSKRISQQKCEEYSQVVTKRSPSNKRETEPDCSLISTGLIVGGTEAFVGEYPHMAAIFYGERTPRCGGTLISDEYILTAAHCIDTEYGRPKKVKLGIVNIKDKAGDYEIMRNGITVHPQYVSNEKYYDLALIKLNRKVQFTKTLRPACLSNSRDIPVNKSVATGWGNIGTIQRPSDILLKVQVTMVENRQCNQVFSSLIANSANGIERGITNDMICAGEKQGGKDTCIGDSGGPLQFSKFSNRCVYELVGVTSFGDKTCAAKGSLGVYVRVSSFLPWIESIVWPNS